MADEHAGSLMESCQYVFPDCDMGRPCHAGTVWPDRLVHRHAGHTDAAAGCSAAERGQHSRLAVFCLHTGLGCQRCRCRDHAGTMDRIFRVPFGGIPPDDSPDRRVCPVWRKRNRNATAGNAQACTDSEESMGRVLPCEQGYLPADALSGGCSHLQVENKGP